MKIQFTDNKLSDQVTLTCSTLEYALFNAALNAFLAAAHNPRTKGDIANFDDIDLANTLEQQMFAAYCNRFPAGHADPPAQPEEVK